MTNVLSPANTSAAILSGKKRPQRRRQYLVNKKTQFRIAGELALILMVGMILGLTNSYFINSFFHISSDPFAEVDIWYPSMSILMWVWIAALVAASLIAIFFLSLYFSNRVAGPARKIEQSIKGIAEGDLSIKIRLRKNDHLQEIAQELNALVADWQRALDAIGENVRALKTETSHLDAGDIQDRLAAIEALLAQQQGTGPGQP